MIPILKILFMFYLTCGFINHFQIYTTLKECQYHNILKIILWILPTSTCSRIIVQIMDLILTSLYWKNNSVKSNVSDACNRIFKTYLKWNFKIFIRKIYANNFRRIILFLSNFFCYRIIRDYILILSLIYPKS